MERRPRRRCRRVAPACTGVTSFLPKSTTTSGLRGWLHDGGASELDAADQPPVGDLQHAERRPTTWTCGVRDDPAWRLFAWGRIDSILPDDSIDSAGYVAVWVADDPADGDGDPTVDTNGTLTLHAEAYGPSGTRKVIEVTVARTASTEIERGQIAQRGQDELNQRARKAAVQQTGKALTNMKMNVTTGTLQ